jgi:hypothetical protein
MTLGKAGSAVTGLALVRGAFALWPLAAAEVGVGWLHDFTILDRSVRQSGDQDQSRGSKDPRARSTKAGRG